MIKIYTTDSYYNIFNILKREVSLLPKDIDNKNFIFTEDKISLMTERVICQGEKGSFNTQVFSFKKFLLSRKSFDEVLSKECSTMIIKRVLSHLDGKNGEQLLCFASSKATLSTSLFDLILLLKSAGITPLAIKKCLEEESGKSNSDMLMNKLHDIYIIYSAYEKYLEDNGKVDQSKQIAFLPQVIEEDKEIENANVFIVGYIGFTAQMREIISSLIKKAKNVIAILPYSKTNNSFVNETASVVYSLAKEYNPQMIDEKTEENLKEVNTIKNYLFSPYLPKGVDKDNKIETDNIFTYSAITEKEEFTKIASVIKQRVIKEKLRYKDFAVVLPDSTKKDHLIKAFNMLDVPFYLDDKYTVENHPLVMLIYSYIDIYRRNFKMEDVINFVKNPIITKSITLADKFTNYLIKKDINYSKIKKPFISDSEDIDDIEEVRKKVVDIFSGEFNPISFLQSVQAENGLVEFNERLKQNGYLFEKAVNEQVYGHIIKILQDIKDILGKEKISLVEYKNILISGISALQISIIPQYNDAVFVGDFKEVGLAKTDYVFITSLVAGVPSFQDDVAILSDSDIDKLSPLNLYVEPKIDIVNKRIREQVLMGFTSFNKGLYLSYTESSESGKQNQKSDLLIKIKSIYKTQKFMDTSNYLTEKQGISNFSKDCGNFVISKITDIEDACSFYKVCDNDIKNRIIENSNRSIKPRLKGNTSLLFNSTASPTMVEDYFNCPYKAFLDRIIGLKEKEKGKIDSRSFGIIVHETMRLFLSDIDNISEGNFDEKFEGIKEKIAKNKKYESLFEGSQNQVDFDSLMRETKKFCKKNLDWKTYGAYKTNPKDLEAVISKDGRFTPLKFLDGKISLAGMVDRVDNFDEYFRVIDFKTGSYEGNVDDLYYGLSLQLYLYSLSIKNSKIVENENGKEVEKYRKLSGIYYMPISDSYTSKNEKEGFLADGVSLGDQSVLEANDINIAKGEKSKFISTHSTKKRSDEQMNASLDYSYLVTEKALEKMQSGFILATPVEGGCKYCQYKAICSVQEENIRKCKSISVNDIVKATTEKN